MLKYFKERDLDVEEVRERVLDTPDDDPRLDQLVGAMDRWLKEHYAP